MGIYNINMQQVMQGKFLIGLNLIFTVQLFFSKVSEHHFYHLKCHHGHCAVAVSHCHGELLQGSGVVGQGKRCSLRRS